MLKKILTIIFIFLTSLSFADKIVTVPDGTDPNSLWTAGVTNGSANMTWTGTTTISNVSVTGVITNPYSGVASIGIGSNSVSINGPIQTNVLTAMDIYQTNAAGILLHSYGVQPGLSMWRAAGTQSNPTIPNISDRLALFAVGGTTNGTNFFTSGRIALDLMAAPTSTNFPTDWVFNNTPYGSITPIETMRISAANGISGNGSLLTNSAGNYFGEGLTSNVVITVTNGSSPATIQAQINAIPKNLNRNSLTINFAAGTYTNAGYYGGTFIILNYFYGGFITLAGPGYTGSARTNQTAIIDIGTNASYTISVRDVSSTVYIQALTFKADTSIDRRMISVTRSGYVQISECYLWGNSTTSGYGVDINFSRAGYVYNCYFNNVGSSVGSNWGSIITTQGNLTTGVTPQNGHVAYNGTIMRWDTNVLGTTDNLKLVGGQISLTGSTWF